MRVCDVAAELDVPPHSFSIALMESRGVITRIAVTPTDILEAEGSYTEFDPRPSDICVSFLARKCGMSTEGFIEHAKSAITRRMAECIMETLLLRETGTDSLGPEQRFLMDHILENHEGYSLSFGMDIPIIGIGAPTGAWLPRVAEMLGTELVLPEHSSIGNAVGAITGYVSEIAEVSVRAVPMATTTSWRRISQRACTTRWQR